MDKLRAEFEKWLEETHGLYGEDVEWQEKRNCYAKFGIHLAFQAWQEAANSPETPDGWVMVPKEPTRQMMSQGHFAMGGTDRGKFRRIYQAMIAAAPKPEK